MNTCPVKSYNLNVILDEARDRQHDKAVCSELVKVEIILKMHTVLKLISMFF
jgi:hypothetical protein